MIVTGKLPKYWGRSICSVAKFSTINSTLTVLQSNPDNRLDKKWTVIKLFFLLLE